LHVFEEDADAEGVDLGCGLGHSDENEMLFVVAAVWDLVLMASVVMEKVALYRVEGARVRLGKLIRADGDNNRKSAHQF
jgi:hypothetical protein